MGEEKATKTLAVFFSKGAFGDCARHAVLAAMEDDRVSKIKVYSASISSIYDSSWNCGCGFDPGKKLKESIHFHKLELVGVDDMSATKEDFARNVNLDGVDAVIAGLGNRQINLGDRVGTSGIQNITAIMKENGVGRLVMMSSIGIASEVSNDKPGMEWSILGKIMGCIFCTVGRKDYKDLVGAENAAKESGVDFLVVRPTGLGEDVKPKGEWFLQKEKFKDSVGLALAKKDVGLFLVQEALQPSLKKQAVVIGSNPNES